MKNLNSVFLATLALVQTAAAAERPLRVLMIGNSFSFSVMAQLPEIVNSQDRHKLDITSMYIGGCPLKRHMEEYRRSVADPTHRPYRIDRFVSGQGRLPHTKGNLPEQLSEAPFDIVTIQQASHMSFRPESWLPWGDELAALVREKQPKAKIVIQQTWSYRADSPLFAKWKMSSDEMFEKLRAVYAERAAHFGCDIIPTGDAVRIFREKTPVGFKSYTAEELKGYVRPKVPPYKGDVVGCYRWRKDRKTAKAKLFFDSIHLNPDGQYLQGCVWYGALFGADVEKIAYAPDYLSRDEAALLRKCAALALAGSKAREEASKKSLENKKTNLE